MGPSPNHSRYPMVTGNEGTRLTGPAYAKASAGMHGLRFTAHVHGPHFERAGMRPQLQLWWYPQAVYPGIIPLY